MKLNQGGIRELFRYSLASISSLSIALYVVFSTIGLIFPGEKYETINDIFSQSGNFEISSEGKDIIGFGGNDRDLEDIKYFGTRRISDKKEYNLSKLALNVDKKGTDITNQSLQNGVIFSHEEDENVEFTGGDKFDIEKIIADLHLQKEKRVAVVAKELGIDWKKEKLDYAKLAGIEGSYNGSLDQNQKIRNYLIANAQEIYKDKHGWNEWDTLPLVAKTEKKVKMNSKEITGQVTYNDVTLKVIAPVGAFPEGTILKIKTLGDEDSTTTFDITFKEVILMTQVNSVDYDAPMASFDISFYDPNDVEFLEELQPAEGKSVYVTFDYGDNNEFKNSEDDGLLAIYHMEDNDDTSIANLVSLKNGEDSNNTKHDSMSIYANTLSVYILTIVSDLDEDISENNQTIMFDVDSDGYIAESDNIVLYSTGINTNSIYTGKILSKDNEIILPNVKATEGYTFSGWFSEDEFLGDAGAKFNLGNLNNSGKVQSGLNLIDAYRIFACLLTEGLSGDVCIVNEDGNFSEESMYEEPDVDIYIPSDEEIEKYGEDVFVAYNWAINNGITTIDDISKVKFNKKITRAELAKMMVVFMSGVLDKEPIITGNVDYSDVDSQKLGDLAGYIQLAYQYQIMGISADGSPIENFNPEKNVTRAEFATVLSRVLFGDTYNQNGKNYYEKHIEALEKANILSNTDPDLVEARGWIMTMLYKSQL